MQIIPYRATPQSIAFAKGEAAKERDAAEVVMLQFERERAIAKQTIRAYLKQYGLSRVEYWIAEEAKGLGL